LYLGNIENENEGGKSESSAIHLLVG